jgi:hypothetical protein
MKFHKNQKMQKEWQGRVAFWVWIQYKFGNVVCPILSFIFICYFKIVTLQVIIHDLQNSDSEFLNKFSDIS